MMPVLLDPPWAFRIRYSKQKVDLSHRYTDDYEGKDQEKAVCPRHEKTKDKGGNYIHIYII